MIHSNLIGKKAPEFHASAVVNGKIVDNFSLEHYRGKYILFFFYPLDFTFVCPTELHAFQEALEEFEKRNCQVIGCSVDSVHCHYAWLNTPRAKGGIQGVEYPLVSDINKTIAAKFGTLHDEEGVAFRGLFLIDEVGIVRHSLINDLPLGRSVAEAIRILDALQHYQQHGEVCPANWVMGERSIKPTRQGIEQYCAN
jgi:peroxiredoxin (alkyl hydroperoxide reductase subunit C)